MPPDHAELHSEQVTHFSVPVANQTCWGHNQDAADQPSGQHFTHVQTSHDCFAGACVVSE